MLARRHECRRGEQPGWSVILWTMKVPFARVQTMRLAALALSVLLTSVAAGAQALTLEQTAQEIARQHNVNAKTLVDDTTVSTSAKADGANVIVTNVIRIRKQLPEEMREEFRKSVGAELMRGVCKGNVGTEAFKRGLYYTLIYVSTDDELLAKLIVSQETCSKLK
jgi:hypothetical protein